MKVVVLLLGLMAFAGCAAALQEHEPKTPRNDDPRLLRKFGVVFTVVRTGEFTVPMQASVYGNEATSRGVVYLPDASVVRDWPEPTQRTELTSESCPAVTSALNFLKSTKGPTGLLPSENYYSPSTNYSLRSVSLVESRHYTFSVAAQTADSVASWAASGYPSAGFVTSLDGILEGLRACVERDPRSP